MRSHRLRAAAGGDTGAIVAGATLHWDFGDTNCWNRTSSTISDLSGNSNNGSLYDYGGTGKTHTYDSSKGGHLVFANTNSQQANGGVEVSGSLQYGTIFRRQQYFGANNGSANPPPPFTFEFIYNASLINLNGAYERSPASSTHVVTTMKGPEILHSYAMDFIGFIDRYASLTFIANTLAQQGFDSTGSSSPGDNGANYNSSAGGIKATSSTFNYGSNATSTGWEQIIVTRTVSGSTFTTNMYRNKTLFYTATNNIDYYSFSIFGTAERFFNFRGSYGIIRGYNQSFSQADVDSQYNAQKSRFGLP